MRCSGRRAPPLIADVGWQLDYRSLLRVRIPASSRWWRLSSHSGRGHHHWRRAAPLQGRHACCFRSDRRGRHDIAGPSIGRAVRRPYGAAGLVARWSCCPRAGTHPPGSAQVSLKRSQNGNTGSDANRWRPLPPDGPRVRSRNVDLGLARMSYWSERSCDIPPTDTCSLGDGRHRKTRGGHRDVVHWRLTAMRKPLSGNALQPTHPLRGCSLASLGAGERGR
jgi:hypothetical protein